MTLDEKRAELHREPEEMAHFAGGINAVMLSANIALVINIFLPYHSLALLLFGLSLFMGGIGPIMGLHFGVMTRLAKCYGTYQRTMEITALDALYAGIAILAMGTLWNHGDSMAIDLLLLASGLVMQVILFRWAFFGKSPIRKS